jgi:hypothetical protein
MTFRSELAKELEIVLKDFRLKKPKSNKNNDYTMEQITVFEQNVPPPKLSSRDSYAPLVVIQTNGGNTDDEGETINVTLIIQTWDDEFPAQGEDDVINIITRIKQHFLAYPRLNKKYWCRREMTWAVDNEQNPFFDGNIIMTWEVPTTMYIQERDYV